MIAATWLVGIADAGVYLSPLSTWIYVVSQYAYDRDWNQPWSTAMRSAEFWFSNANCVIAAGLYFIIIAFLSIQVTRKNVLISRFEASVRGESEGY
jgi:hypothetical protein